MTLSREARLVAGVTLLTVPTIMYGGATLLGTLTRVRLESHSGIWRLTKRNGRCFARGTLTRECGSFCPS
jgi:hypothetical protein